MSLLLCCAPPDEAMVMEEGILDDEERNAARRAQEDAARLALGLIASILHRSLELTEVFEAEGEVSDEGSGGV